MTIEKDFFRRVMGQFATGVTIATTSSKGAVAGLTVNAFCSVSLDPPLVLICVDLTSTTLPVIRESGVFAVNMLTDEQEGLSQCFASPTPERYEYFCNASYHTAVTGSPILDGVLAFVDTQVVAEYPAGDHVIFLGQIVAMGTDGRVVYADELNNADIADANLTEYTDSTTETDKLPLAYYRGQYRHITYGYSKPSLAK